jgi:DNA-binding transcriptional regulator YiaG
MPDIWKALTDEIRRLARKEAKTAVGTLRKDNAALRHAVADLKRRVVVLEAQCKRPRAGAEKPAAPAPEVKAERARISAEMVQRLRAKLGLTQKDFADLLGVSRVAVRLWEGKTGRLGLRGESKAAVVRVRTMGKREAKKRLAEMRAKG